MNKIILGICALLISTMTFAANNNDLIVQLKGNSFSDLLALKNMVPEGSTIKSLNFKNYVHVTVPENRMHTFSAGVLSQQPEVNYVQPNYKIKLVNTVEAQEQEAMNPIKDICEIFAPKELCDIIGGGGGGGPTPPPGDTKPGDNPDFPAVVVNPNVGSDPMIDQQWGMNDIEVSEFWSENTKEGTVESDLIVAVIDTGVDYTHEDLAGNMWRNPGEDGLDENGNDKSTNGIDDDGNGYIDDLMGWDFARKDNKPFDLKSGGPFGGNPGHGTHCAGNVGARGGNGIGISGVAQSVKIMALRFLTEDGQGTTADAILSIKYAVDNGAKITSNSWGSAGENPSDPSGNKALRDMIAYSQEKGVLFVAAAGNGDRAGRGYDNDTSRTPAYPASYDNDIIVSVAALDERDNLGSFSNWGAQTVDLGAPGVNVYSTFPANKYGSISGTSMATPHVAGAAALYWSKNPDKTWVEVKEALLSSAVPISALTNKATSNGKLNVKSLMAFGEASE